MHCTITSDECCALFSLHVHRRAVRNGKQAKISEWKYIYTHPAAFEPATFSTMYWTYKLSDKYMRIFTIVDDIFFCFTLKEEGGDQTTSAPPPPLLSKVWAYAPFPLLHYDLVRICGLEKKCHTLLWYRNSLKHFAVCIVILISLLFSLNCLLVLNKIRAEKLRCFWT